MSRVLFIVVGAIAGLIFIPKYPSPFAGLIIGTIIGFVLYELHKLTSRVSRLERDQSPAASKMERAPLKESGQTASGQIAAGPETAISDDDRYLRSSAAPVDTGATPETTVQPDGYRSKAMGLSRDERPLPPPAGTVADRRAGRGAGYTGTADVVIEKLKEWFTSGNVPVKVGVIVSFFGVAFLLKYAVDRNLINVPMWLRLVFAASFGVVLLIVGWRLRKRMRIYALSLQGGGVGIIYLTVFAAFRLYGLLPPATAFALLAFITVPAAILAIVQDARAMAVLAITGGFLAPILSPGGGSHVALFSYYLLLNIAIVGIAWFKSWRELNLIGFLFTFVIGTMWGYQYYRPEYLVSTEPFLVAHFLLYQLAAILFAFRQPPRLRGIVDGTLIFGTPIVAFGLQAAVLDNTEYGLAYSAVALAVFYAAIAWWLHGREKTMVTLRDSYVVLAVAFATVAVPLALDASWTAATWAMEGAALVWLSVRQERLLARFTGIALIVFAGFSFVVGGWHNDAGLTVFNGNVLGGTLISLAGLISARNLGRIEPLSGRWLAIALFVWGAGWWLATGLMEIDDRVRYSLEYPAQVGFFVFSGAILSLAGRLLNWQLARIGSLLTLPLLVLTLFERSMAGGHPFESHATIPWVLAAAAHLYILKPVDSRARLAALWHVGGVLLAAWVFAWEIDWWMVVDTWSNATISLVLTALALFCLLGKALFTWPLQQQRTAYVTAAGMLLGLNLLFVTAFSLASPGDPLPLLYLPLLNPYTIVALAALVAGYFWISPATDVYRLSDEQKRLWLLLLGAAVFILSTIAVVRAVHHFADVPWRQAALIRSVEVQSALSIYWALLGFGAMVLGARWQQRWLWLAGTGLMALVVIKLFLIDLSSSGTVARIVSFLGVGVLLLIVGYIAPVPPRDTGMVKKEG